MDKYISVYKKKYEDENYIIIERISPVRECVLEAMDNRE